MATQYADITPLSFPAAPIKPTIRIAFVAGPAVQAVCNTIAAMPVSQQDATLDDLAIAAETRELIAEAKAMLSPAVYAAFLRWGEAASHFASDRTTDQEAALRCDACCDAARSLASEPVRNIHDFALKAYVQTLETTDSSCFGPLRNLPPGDRQELVIDLAAAVATDALWISPIPALLDGLATRAASQSPSTMFFSEEVGSAIISAFSGARGEASADTEFASAPNPVTGVPAGYDRFMRGPLIQWQRQFERYETARDALKVVEKGMAQPTVADTDRAEALQLQFDSLLDVEHNEIDRLLRMPAPSAAELAIKLQILERYQVWELTYCPEAIHQITIDARRFGCFGAHLQTDAALSRAFAGRCAEFASHPDVGTGVGDDDAQMSRIDAHEAVITKGTATTIEGVLAKLRVGFANLLPSAWSDHALGNPGCSEFQDGLRMGDMYEQLMWSGICDLARIAGVDLKEQGA